MTDKKTDISLEALSFEHRSEQEKRHALSRPTASEATVETRHIDRAIAHGESPFGIDKGYVSGGYMFRRLSNMGQLAPSFSHGFQNRATHTEHVAQVAERLSRRLGLSHESSALAQSIVYTHDIGHAPFSHAAEDVFNEKLGGGWDHNYFGQRVLLEFAHGGISYEGLPLTAATLEGMIKRYKRFASEDQITQEQEKLKPIINGNFSADHYVKPLNDLPSTVRQLDAAHDHLFHLDEWNCVEGQVASIADWLAYTVSDTRDMLLLRMHQLPPNDFKRYFEEEITQHFPPLSKVKKQMDETMRDMYRERGGRIVKKDYNARMQSMIGVFTRALEEELLQDVVEETKKRYAEQEDQLRGKPAESVRNLPTLLVSFSSSMVHDLEAYEAYMKESVFPQLLQENTDVHEVMRSFFDLVEAKFEGKDIANGYSNGVHPLSIDAGWKEIYEQIKSDTSLDETTREKDLKGLVATYITCNFTDHDVLYFVRHYDKGVKIQSGRMDDVYPAIAPPGTKSSLLAERIAEREEHQSWRDRQAASSTTGEAIFVK